MSEHYDPELNERNGHKQRVKMMAIWFAIGIVVGLAMCMMMIFAAFRGVT